MLSEMRWSLTIALLGGWCALWGQRFALPPQLAEVSGLYVAGPDSLWWHNDSGNPPVLYCTDGRGRIKDSLVLPVANRDWEDLTADTAGHLYIGDFGNNANRRTDLVVWRVPLRLSANGALEPQSLPFFWPDQRAFPPAPQWRNFDCEGFFWARDSLYLFSKDKVGRRRGHYRTKLYVLPARSDGPGAAILRDSLDLPRRVVTGAALSADGSMIAWVSYDFRRILGVLPWSRASIFVLSGWNGYDFKGVRIWRKHVSFLLPAQYEAIDFLDDETLLIARERTPLSRQLAKAVSLRRLKRWMPKGTKPDHDAYPESRRTLR